jgi:hypothetical protein
MRTASIPYGQQLAKERRLVRRQRELQRVVIIRRFAVWDGI